MSYKLDSTSSKALDIDDKMLTSTWASSIAVLVALAGDPAHHKGRDS